MGEATKIQWTATPRVDGTMVPGHTFNPWRGCVHKSEGCRFCYAEVGSKRNPAVLGIWGPNGTRVIASESMWAKPLKWNRDAAAAGERHKVFCASFADVFEDRPELVSPRRRLADLIWDTPHLDWLLLTKRPENAQRMIYEMWFDWAEWPKNYWLGVSCENQATADERIPLLLQVPAAVRFLSCEPLLGPIDLRTGIKIDWVIVGGESHVDRRKARPFDLAWARAIVGQCQAADVPVFVKQLGSAPFDSGLRVSIDGPDSHAVAIDLRDSKGGDISEWPNDLRVRQFPELKGSIA